MDNVVIRLRLIGPMEAYTVTGKNILPSGRKTRALLACIAMTAPRPAFRNRLTELLWSRSPEQQARASLRQEIRRLLDALSPAEADLLIITRDHLTLRPGAVWTDIEEVKQVNSDSPAALSLLDADLLEDLDRIDPRFDAWLQIERDHLRNRGLRIAESMLHGVLTSSEAIEAAQKLLMIDRSHESAWRTLMRTHASCGERGLAIRAYNGCRAALAEMLDATPSEETQKLWSEIRGPSDSQMPARSSGFIEAAAYPAAKPEFCQKPQSGQHLAKDEILVPLGIRVGVMPFRLIASPTATTHLALGLADEITHALSRFRWMCIVSSDSLNRFATDKRDEALIKQQFGVAFLLDGSVQQIGSNIRVSVQLLDLRVNNQIVWARRFDRETDDLLSLQDDIAAEVVAQIDPEILMIEVKRSIRRGLVNATAYDLMLHAIPLMGRLERAMFMQAGQHLADAITLEPDYAPAHAWYAYWHILLVGQGWADNPKVIMQKAGRLAERAIVLDPFDARGLSISGHVQAFLHRRLGEAMVLHKRSLSLNPNLAMAWALSAMTQAYAGDPNEAKRCLEHYKKLSPFDLHAFMFDGFFGVIHLMKGDYKRAVEVGRSTSLLYPTFSASYKPYLAALGHLRRDEEAATVRGHLLALEPDFTIKQFLEYNPMERDGDKMHYAEGLRLAGIPK